MNNLNNQLKVNTNKISGGLDAEAMGSLMNSANILNSSDGNPDDTPANPSDDTSNNANNDDVDMTKLVKETLQKIHDQMCISIEDNSETLTNNVQNMIIKNSDWKYLGKQLTDIFTSKVSSMLNNIDLMIVATDNNEFPEMNDQPEPSNEENTPDKNPDEEENTPDKNPDEEEKTPDQNPDEEEKTPDKNPDEEEKTPDKNPDEEEKTPDQNPDNPPPPPAAAVSGGKKRKSIKVKYLSKNKTRKNLI